MLVATKMTENIQLLQEGYRRSNNTHRLIVVVVVMFCFLNCGKSTRAKTFILHRSRNCYYLLTHCIRSSISRELSSNKLKSLPDYAFSGCSELLRL